MDKELQRWVEDNLRFMLTSDEVPDRDTPANVVDGLFAIAEAITGLTYAVNKLGLADALTPMGAIEALSLEIKNGFAALADAVDAHE